MFVEHGPHDGVHGRVIQTADRVQTLGQKIWPSVWLEPQSKENLMPLSELSFSDLYLGEVNRWVSGVPQTLDPIPAPEDCFADLDELRELCVKSHAGDGKEEFSIAHKGVTYRASLLQSLSENVFVLRRFPKEIPPLETLNIHPHYVSLLLGQRLSGLIVVAGAYGQGKTTTASSIVAGRIAKHGGVAVCIEDPPEMPLEGRHGEGVVYQRWVDKGGFAHECRQAARWAPSIIFVGEVRDSETATEALRASINGRLVVCTIHSDNVRTAVDRLFALANGVAGTSDDVASLLATGLLAIVHQRLEGEPRRPKIEFLWLGGEDALGIRSTIRQRKFMQLDNEITLQRNNLLMQSRGR